MAEYGAVYLTEPWEMIMSGTKHSYQKTTLAAGLLLALVACNGNGNQPDAGPDNLSGEAAYKSGQDHTEVKMSKRDQIAFSKEELAARLEIDPDAVSLSGAIQVMWRSGALGCPEPGMNYTQALVPGIWVSLRVGNTPYRYHAIPGGQPFYCPAERAEPPVTGSGAD